ncbi:unnamed protein product [Urochloa humidicola]
MGSRKGERRFLILAAAAAVFHLLHAPPLVSCADTDVLVYKGCANQSFPGGVVPPTIAVLSSALSAQSGSAKFYKTSSSTSSAGSSTSISGLFQCREDLSGSDCASCVSHSISSWRDACGASIAARVQFTGCLTLYEVSGFPQVSGVQILFNICGTGSGGGDDFEMRRDTAFAALEGGVATSSGGFVAISYQGVYAMAQCEGDLFTGDCGHCITQAVQHVVVECGGAPSGQVYLDKCYVSYTYYIHGVPQGRDMGEKTAPTSSPGNRFPPRIQKADIVLMPDIGCSGKDIFTACHSGGIGGSFLSLGKATARTRLSWPLETSPWSWLLYLLGAVLLAFAFYWVYAVTLTGRRRETVTCGNGSECCGCSGEIMCCVIIVNN